MNYDPDINFPVPPPNDRPFQDIKWLYITPLYSYCQKVLPTVYDDSLSYYEVLGKMQELLNRVIINNNNLPDYIKNELRELVFGDEFKKYLSSLLKAFNNEINVKFPPIDDTGEQELTLEPAKGDGETDDTVAIQKILDYAGKSGGGLVFFPTGVYMVDHLELPENVLLRGQDRYTSLIKQRDDVADTLLVGGGEFFTCEKLGFKGNYHIEHQEMVWNDLVEWDYNSMIIQNLRFSDGDTLLTLNTEGDCQASDILFDEGQDALMVLGNGRYQCSNFVFYNMHEGKTPVFLNCNESKFDGLSFTDDFIPLVRVSGNSNELTINSPEVASNARSYVNYVEDAGNFNKIEIVGTQETNALSGDKTTTLGGNYNLSVGGDKMDEVKGNDELAVTGSRIQTVEQNLTDNIRANYSVNIGGDYQNTVNGNFREEVHGSKTQENFSVTSITNHGTVTERTTGNHIETVTGSINQLATQDNVRRGQSVESYAGTPDGAPDAVNGTNLIAGQEVELWGNPRNGIMMNQSPKQFNPTWNYINYTDSSVTPVQVHKIPLFKESLNPDVYHNHWVTPEMYGAVGDGVHDDTEAFNLWVAEGLSPHLLLNKTYNVGSITITNSLFILGSSLTRSIVQVRNNWVIRGQGTVIQNVNFVATNEVSEVLMYIQAPDVRITDCVLNHTLQTLGYAIDIQDNSPSTTLTRVVINGKIDESVQIPWAVVVNCGNIIIQDCEIRNGILKYGDAPTSTAARYYNSIFNTEILGIEAYNQFEMTLDNVYIPEGSNLTLVPVQFHLCEKLKITNSLFHDPQQICVMSNVHNVSISNTVFHLIGAGTNSIFFEQCGGIRMFSCEFNSGSVQFDRNNGFTMNMCNLYGHDSGIYPGTKYSDQTNYEYVRILNCNVPYIDQSSYPASKLILQNNFPLQN